MPSPPRSTRDRAADAAEPPVRIARRLAAIADRPLNFDRRELAGGAPSGWTVDDVRHPLPSEPPGPPLPGGSWEIAKRLIAGYEFADPSIVRAYFTPGTPLRGRTMLLRLRALGLFQLFVGVRVLDVIDEERQDDTGPARVWGWRYGTLQGHVERGEMSWEVWKRLDTGEVDFRINAVSRSAAIANPVVWLGFRLVGPHERTVFLRSTGMRMQRLTEQALRSDDGRPDDDAARELTARPLPAADAEQGRLVHRPPASDR